MSDKNSNGLLVEDASINQEDGVKKARKAAIAAEARTVKILADLQALIDRFWTKSAIIFSASRDGVNMVSYESVEAEQKESLAGLPQIKWSRRFSFVDPETQAELRGYDVFYIVLHTGEKAASAVPLYLHFDGGWRRVALCDGESAVVEHLFDVLMLTSLLLPSQAQVLLEPIERRIAHERQLFVV